MKSVTKWMATAGTLAVLAAAAPAAGQSYDYRYNRDRDVIEEVIDGVARVAGAVTGATRGGYYDPRYGYGYGSVSPYGYGNASRYGYGYDRGGERYAADACAYEAQRRYARRYGRVGVDIRNVDWYRNNRLRVYGTLDVGDYGGYDRYGSYGYYDRSDRYGRSRYASRLSFTCTVRPDGRVTGFNTNRSY